MGLDEIPRDPNENENRQTDLDTVENIEQELRQAAEKKRAGELSNDVYEALSPASQRALRRASPDCRGATDAESTGARGEPGLQPVRSRESRRGRGRRSCGGFACIAGDRGSRCGRRGRCGAGGLLTLAIAQYITTC